MTTLSTTFFKSFSVLLFFAVVASGAVWGGALAVSAQEDEMSLQVVKPQAGDVVDQGSCSVTGKISTSSGLEAWVLYVGDVSGSTAYGLTPFPRVFEFRNHRLGMKHKNFLDFNRVCSKKN